MTATKRRVAPQRVRDAMTVAGVASNSALARAVGVPPSAVTRWLDGTTAPSGPSLERLCAVLRVTPAYLFGVDERPEALIEEATRRLGPSYGRGLQLLARLTPPEMDRLAEHLEGWVSATEAARTPEVRFPVDDARATAEPPPSARSASAILGPTTRRR